MTEGWREHSPWGSGAPCGRHLPLLPPRWPPRPTAGARRRWARVV